MEARKPKAIQDLPQFIVDAIHRGETNDDGYTRFELHGRFTDRNLKPAEHWFWLLYGERECVTAGIKSIDEGTGEAILTCDESSEPKVTGASLAYLSPYWQAFHVWMVNEPKWVWERKEFRGTDAVAEDYEAEKVSIVDGRQIKVWTKLVPVGGGNMQRHYPAEDQASPVRIGTRVIAGAWGHEHCELCRAHIDADEFGYEDLSNRWLCESCYAKYVVNHDLSFIDDQ